MNLDQAWVWSMHIIINAWWLFVWVIALITATEVLLVLFGRLGKVDSKEMYMFGFSWAILIIYWFN